MHTTSSTQQQPPEAASTAEAAERRLREAEHRLKEAIAELHRRQSGAPESIHPPCDHADESCIANAVGNLCQSFLLSYGIRVGIGILLRAFKLARLKSYSSLLDIKQLVSEKDLIVREEACRIGLLFGGFTGSYHALRCLLRKLRKETPVNTILAGAVSGLSILALDDSSRRRTLALYLFARLAQSAYNSAKSKNKFHLWGSHWSHGDTLLFSLACAQFLGYLTTRTFQIMYAFVMRPESLPKSYRDFIQKTGPVAAPVYKAVRDCCRVILAGAVSGLSILALDDSSRRRTLALYLFARLAQSAYNSAKSKNKFHLWGSHWSHGDTLLFSLACAQFLGYLTTRTFQIMYAFVMRPESLPKSYRDFIQKTGPVAAPVYKAVRDCCRGSPVDVDSLSAYLSSKRISKTLKLEKFPDIIPCSIIHPDTNSCLVHNGNVATSTFRKTFPLYFSLTFVPFVVLRLQKFMDAPVRTCRHAVAGAVRSTTFLSAFVGIFQGVICLHRKVALRDHKLVYWLAGGVAALSVLLEKKARRGELALYVLPRAGESLWYILVNRRLLPDIKNAEVALFCACMGGIMYYLEHEPDTMAPFLRGLIRRFLASRISNPGPPSSRNASYTYLQTLDATKKPEVQDNGETGTSSSARYDLESIPGL
ncbi:hypothetical protein OROMI_008682 [Orobanche minor]